MSTLISSLKLPAVYPTGPPLYPVSPDKIELPDLFCAAFMHEIRNPLTNINLAVELLRSSSFNDVELEYLEIILRGSAKVNSLVNELIRQQVLTKEKKQTHSICELLDDVLLMAQDRLHLKGIVTTKFYDTLGLVRLVDPPGMQMALTNIIINAIDAMPGNGNLSIIASTVTGRLLIQIGDNGCGISDDNLQKIFKPYFSTKESGLGIGLSVTLDILRKNKVVVTVTSEIGRGTTFTLAFAKEKVLKSKRKII